MTRARPIKRTPRPLVPEISILLVSGGTLLTLPPHDVTPSRVGLKAVGLASVPRAWTKPFFVVDGSVPTDETAISEALACSGLSASQKLLVRSSGVHESMENRGALRSVECDQHTLGAVIDRLRSDVPPETAVHWVIQDHVDCVAKGHLSNERRVARDKRDWVAELEAARGATSEFYRIPLRTWRDKRLPSANVLRCPYRESILACLAAVARWTYERLVRVHFEWVWDGHAVYLVQADECDDIPNGTDPHKLVADTPSTSISDFSLLVFRTATAKDFAHYRKLANAKIYGDLGYEQVPFFVLDSEQQIRSILETGKCSEELLRDLVTLTARPLVIRTDGGEIPRTLREMLPRSDELRSADAAKQWLLGEFSKKVCATSSDGRSLSDSKLCLIAHHFLPAAAAAWCQAHPDRRRVRIESLWGIPEGLYWYAYDVFDVDTLTPLAPAINARPGPMPTRERLRYKERFIAPDREGAWVVHRTSEGADWARSITKSDWIHEIAWTSRCIAHQERKPVVVMWLIDTAKGSTKHRVLPWYHQEWKQEGQLQKAAPRKKFSSSSEVTVQSISAWRLLQDAIADGQPIARIRIDPREPEMVRDQRFVEELATVAKRNNVVVELSGGILSHAYYMLMRAGCNVECADLDDFAVDEDAIEYNKLVRDRIPQAIAEKGETVAVMKLRGEALIAAIRRKLVEEAFEAFDAKTAEQITEELADLREVALSLMAELEISDAEVETARRQKRTRRGGFEKGLMLGRTAVSSPLATRPSTGDAFPEAAHLNAETLTRAVELPSTLAEGLHVDLRHDEKGAAERQLTLVLPVYAEGFSPPVSSFDLPTSDGRSHPMRVEVRVERTAADLRIRLRLINAPNQLDLALPPSSAKAE